MGTIRNFEEMELWQEARRLYKVIIYLTESGPASKDFKFRDQIKSASASVMDNIAEGHDRDSRLENINHLSIAKGSAGEVRSQLYRGMDNNYWSEETASVTIKDYLRLSAKIAGYIQYLNNSEIKGLKFKDRSKA